METRVKLANEWRASRPAMSGRFRRWRVHAALLGFVSLLHYYFSLLYHATPHSNCLGLSQGEHGTIRSLALGPAAPPIQGSIRGGGETTF